MKNKDTILLEQAYSKILKENKINVLGGMVNLNGDVVPAENSIKANKLSFNQDPDDPRSILSDQMFNVDGKKAVLKVEEDSSNDDMWNNYSFIDSETKEHIANMNWGRGGLTYDDVLDYIEIGLPAGVLRKSENSPYPTRINMSSDILNKFINGSAEKEGLELIPRKNN
jgi:hypothetical protein